MLYWAILGGAVGSEICFRIDRVPFLIFQMATQKEHEIFCGLEVHEVLKVDYFIWFEMINTFVCNTWGLGFFCDIN